MNLKMIKEPLECCPYCGSNKGYYSLSDYIDVPYHVNFNGEPLNNSEMYDNTGIIKTHRDAYCSSCNKKLGTLNSIEKMISRKNK